MIKTNLLRLLTALSFLSIFTLSLSAQEKNDSVFTFRFYTGSNKFYAPGLNNGAELARMFDCVDKHKDLIKDHKIYLYVNGYSISKGSKAKNLIIAKIRSNRVKSELITRKGLKENNFITRNHVGDGNFVTVQLEVTPDAQESRTEEPEPIANEPGELIIAPVPDPEDEFTTVESETIDVQEPEESAVSETVEEILEGNPEDSAVEKSDSRFALKTNMLFYAILMPNIEVEWKFADRWSAALEWQGAWYAKNDPHKVYRLSTVIPEVRYWVIDRARWHGMYVGVFVGGGLYDLSNGGKGHEGGGGLVGVSAGYMWPISKHLSLDASLGVGYLRVRDKEYIPRDGHFLYQMTKNINYFGPLRLKLSLVWRIPK